MYALFNAPAPLCRPRLLVMATPESLELLSEFGHGIRGIDSTFDKTPYRYPLLAEVVNDSLGRGYATYFALATNEKTEMLKAILQIVEMNTPCDERRCTHEMCVLPLEDRSGWITFRKCSKWMGPCAMSHDKVWYGMQPITIPIAVLEREKCVTVCIAHMAIADVLFSYPCSTLGGANAQSLN